MVPTEIKDRLARSFEQMRITTILDKTTLKNCWNEIARALLDADFPESLVTEFEGKIQTIIDANDQALEKCNLIYKTIFEELSKTLDPRKSASIQGKLESVVIFIGLQGQSFVSCWTKRIC